MLFRQVIEMKQCSAYGKVQQRRGLPAVPQIQDSSEAYEMVGESDGVYEKIPGES